MLSLTRGDTATLSFADLATDANVTLPTFEVDDVVAFTLRQSYDSLTALIALVSTSEGAITVDTGFATGSVNVGADDWNVGMLSHTLIDCPWDLQLTRAGAVTTLASSTLAVRPDVTRA